MPQNQSGESEARSYGELARLLVIMARLRDPLQGCDWDRAQDFASIAPYTIEEAYEVADAIHRGDMAGLCDELGDLLLQVVFHSRMAQEAGAFDIDDVIDGICAKMERRHPHIFGAAEQSPGWEAIKAQERAGHDPDPSALAGVAQALPALKRADKLQRRAARTGFDWPEAGPVFAKLNEEVEELRAATTAQDREEEMGDLLFAAVNLARHHGVDAEHALARANRKFERRFRAMEGMAGAGFATLSLADQEELWVAAKRAERDPATATRSA